MWEVAVLREVEEWLLALDDRSFVQVAAAIDLLSEEGPQLGRPLVDRISHSTIANLKELRPGSVGKSEIRLLFVFDPNRMAIILVGGDKSGNWSKWYEENIPLAEKRYGEYLEGKNG